MRLWKKNNKKAMLKKKLENILFNVIIINIFRNINLISHIILYNR